MYNLIVAHDRNYGIGLNGKLPWYFSKDMKYFSKLTRSNIHNIVVMGRNTWESIPKSNRPLYNRVNIIISTKMSRKGLYDNVHVCRSFDEMILLLKEMSKQDTSVWFIGGPRIYKEALTRQLISKLYVTFVHGTFECDTFLDPVLMSSFHTHKISSLTESNLDSTNKDGFHNKYLLEFREQYLKTEENQYLDLIHKILVEGNIRKDRTGVGTKSIFGAQMRFSLRNNKIPLLTTKRVFFRGVVEELLWFLRGDTNVKNLQEKNVRIWDGNSTRGYLDSIGLTNYDEGELGPVYGFQWRHFGSKYKNCHTNYTGKGIDQIATVIDLIKKNPTSRRIIFSAWNPVDLDKMALPPCHVLYQFYVNEGELSCSLYQRSGDMGLGIPFNIASASVLTYILAHICDLKPGELIHTIGDAHVYLNHIEGVTTQIKRVPRAFPNLHIINDEASRTVETLTYKHFVLTDYNPMKSIRMKMAV
tara:strand:+ start:627 stop:2045 length:1419 start_codon:yes stop_codon:yes gene_type:complete